MVHCGSIRQTASIIEMSAECLRTGDKARVKFRFVKHPEYLKVRARLGKFLDIIKWTPPDFDIESVSNTNSST